MANFCMCLGFFPRTLNYILAGLTPLMHAVKTNNIVIVRKLLDMGPNLYLRDDNGCTAFDHLIAIEEANAAPVTFDNVDIFELLTNANPKLAKESSLKLYDLAVEANAYKIANFLANKFKSFKPVGEVWIESKVPPKVQGLSFF